MGHVVTLETRQKISISNKNRTQESYARKDNTKIYRYEKNDTQYLNPVESFLTIQLACQKYDINHSNISGCVNNTRQTAGGYRWRRK